MALGFSSYSEHALAFVWSGRLPGEFDPIYYSESPGTFNINPEGGLTGFRIGSQTMASIIEPLATSNWVNSIRGVFPDIASNVVYHVVVSNGHWLIIEEN